MRNKTCKIYLKKTNRKRKNTYQNTKENKFNHALQKIKTKKIELKSVEEDEVTNLIKATIETYSDTEVYNGDDDSRIKIGPMGLDKMCVASNTIFGVRHGNLWDT